jgi:hypothetical protein
MGKEIRIQASCRERRRPKATGSMSIAFRIVTLVLVVTVMASMSMQSMAHASTMSPLSTTTATAGNNDNVAELQNWQMRQLQLYQVRSTLLSEALSKRLSASTSVAGSNSGSSILPTVSSVSTIDGSQQRKTDWDCTVSTEAHPKPCLYSFDAPPNSKVVAPAGTTQWISISALNRLRRLDPSKVEPMWHNQYLIHQSWFSTESTSMLQHVGIKGWFISSVLLDRPYLFRCMLALVTTIALISILPVLEYAFNFMILNSSAVWDRYNNWARFLHTAFPFKLLMAQMAWKFVATKFETLERKVMDHIVDLECDILEESVPVTLRDEDEMEAELQADEEHVVDVMVDEDEPQAFFGDDEGEDDLSDLDSDDE